VAVSSKLRVTVIAMIQGFTADRGEVARRNGMEAVIALLSAPTPLLIH
jgi:hypothetical protein